MHAGRLEVMNLPVGRIFLDPNNPRFWSEQNTREVADARIPDERVQATARTNIDRHDIEELYNSILRNGFLTLDRIVVRAISGEPERYVVVEGNRRFRSLSRVREDIEANTIAEEDLDEDYLERLRAATAEIEVLVYRGSESDDISWLLQGIRHISGIKDWEPAQRAKLVAKQIDEERQTFRSAGQQFGLSPQAVGRLYRTYKAIEQMRGDDEFGAKARNDYFSLFEEAYRNTFLREWFGWNDDERRFTNVARIKRFYSWITPDDERADRSRRIHNPKQIKELAYLIQNNQNSLIAEFEDHEVSISDAYGRAVGQTKPKDWRKAVETARTLIADLPSSAIFDEPAAIIEELERLVHMIGQRVETARQQLRNA